MLFLKKEMGTSMLNQKNREPNFIEKRRQWNSKVQKPFSRRTWLMVLPALILSVFVLMSAPYLKLIMEEFMQEGDEMTMPVQLNIDEKEVKKREGPPPSADAVILQDYRASLEKEGFDWRQKPKVEGPDLSYAREQDLPIEPIAVELPNTMTELRSESKTAETPSE